MAAIREIWGQVALGVCEYQKWQEKDKISRTAKFKVCSIEYKAL